MQRLRYCFFQFLKATLMKKKHSYKFDPHTLTYEKVKVGVKEKVKAVSFTVAFGVVLAVLLTFIAFKVIDSPKERQLKREISQYEHQIDKINRKMELLDEELEDLQNRDDNIYRTIFEAEPISDEVRNSGIGGVERYNDLQGYDNSEEITSTMERLDNISKRMYVQSLSFDEVYKLAKNKTEYMASMPAIMPVKKNSARLVSGFGSRFHPILHYRRMHTGVDLAAKKGTPIYATGDGVVEVSGTGNSNYSGYGVVCVINHGFGFKTLYGHMSEVKVTPGKKVKRGELIGRVGSTGLSQAPHLHYEVIQNGKRVNPVYFFFNDLTPSEYEQVIQDANQENQCLS